MEDARPHQALAASTTSWRVAHDASVRRILDGKPVGPLDRLRIALGNLLVYGPLRNRLGMSRIRVAYTAGEAIGPDLFSFYRSIGINLKQLYGSTEAVRVRLHPAQRRGQGRHRRAAGRRGRDQDQPTPAKS